MGADTAPLPHIDTVNFTLTGREALLYLFPALAVISGVCGFALCRVGFRLLRQRRSLQHIPRPAIRGAAPGIAELHGLARGETTVAAAITGQPCYYYRVVVWQEDTARTWQKVAEETELIPFYLDDMTGPVQVNPCGAEMDLLRDFHEEYGRATLETNTDLPTGVANFLARHNLSTANGVRIEEYRISPQSPLFITGTLAETDASQLAAVNCPAADSVSPTESAVSRRGDMTAPAAWLGPEVVRLSPQTAVRPATAMSMQSRVAAALVRAGESNGLIWDSPSPVAVAPAQPGEAGVGPMLAVGKGERDSPFAISWRSRRGSAGSSVWPAAALVLGFLLLVASLYSILTSLSGV